MLIEVGLWRISEKPQKMDFSPMDSESQLEQVLVDDISIILARAVPDHRETEAWLELPGDQFNL